MPTPRAVLHGLGQSQGQLLQKAPNVHSAPFSLSLINTSYRTMRHLRDREGLEGGEMVCLMLLCGVER